MSKSGLVSHFLGHTSLEDKTNNNNGEGGTRRETRNEEKQSTGKDIMGIRGAPTTRTSNERTTTAPHSGASPLSTLW